MDGGKKRRYTVHTQKMDIFFLELEENNLKQKYWKGTLVFLMLGVLMVIFLTEEKRKNEQALSYTEFWQLAENGKISGVQMGAGANWLVELTDGTKAITPIHEQRMVKNGC